MLRQDEYKDHHTPLAICNSDGIYACIYRRPENALNDANNIL
jgi:hypothetical protein